MGNPCTEWPGYRAYVVATLPHLKKLVSYGGNQSPTTVAHRLFVHDECESLIHLQLESMCRPSSCSTRGIGLLTVPRSTAVPALAHAPTICFHDFATIISSLFWELCEYCYPISALIYELFGTPCSSIVMITCNNKYFRINIYVCTQQTTIVNPMC